MITIISLLQSLVHTVIHRPVARLTCSFRKRYLHRILEVCVDSMLCHSCVDEIHQFQKELLCQYIVKPIQHFLMQFRYSHKTAIELLNTQQKIANQFAKTYFFFKGLKIVDSSGSEVDSLQESLQHSIQSRLSSNISRCTATPRRLCSSPMCTQRKEFFPQNCFLL